MRDEIFERGHADGSDQAVFRARLSGRRSAVTALAILVAVATAIVAAGSSRYLPGAGAGANAIPSGSPSAVVSSSPRPSLSPTEAPSLSPAPAPTTPPNPKPSARVAWTDATPSPIAAKHPVKLPVHPELVQVAVTEMELPAYAMAGTPMNYSIVLTNDGDTPVSLDPCPGYRQSIFGMPDNEVGGGVVYLLNCAAMGSVIAPGRSFTLEMVYDVPATTPDGRQLFFWVCDADAFRAAIKAEIEIRSA
jgi:hypothetical protein